MADIRALARHFIEALPHARELGLDVTDMGDGYAEMTMPYDPRLVGDPKTGVIHGGAVSALMDTCCGSAVMSHKKVGNITATLDLRIEYLRSAAPGQMIVARATCHHVTRSVAFVRAEAFDDNRDLPVATASGSFTVGTA
jgi:uncharacterized protein (TIGR00369 family)